MASSSGSSSATSSLAPSTTVSSSATSPASSTSSSSSGSDFFPSPTTGGASATNSQDPGPFNGPASSSLYLFTFLATLFLLLAISSAIIMRGIFLRRRFRRRLEEALAAGVLLSPTDDGSGGFGRGSGGRRKLKRPTLYDVSVLPPYFSTADPQDGKWERIMPVSASVSSERPGLDPLPTNESTHTVEPPPRGHLTAGMLLERAGFIIPHRARLRRARAAPSQPPSTGDAPPSPSIPPEQKDPVLRAAEVQVAVVIAMPNPHRSAYLSPAAAAREASATASGLHLGGTGKGKARGSGTWDDGEEEGVPDVVLGSARVALCGQDGSERELS
ncbi:hypothetical protein OH77DRAFT_1521446 [Trametes cingulata]|nr:hypothetical protein OH77DRAFT_1521446 [Trametes cingulata]